MRQLVKASLFGLGREEWEAWEMEHLAPYAAKAGKSRGRKYPEQEHAYRTAFQRDRDRILHSSAFRRLEYKTQVFVYHEGDYYRTRLTHSLETAQIARTIARILRLNEDLCETLALAHDLGHPPFGHAGESVMNELMAQNGGFNHNRQGLRIVEVLEDRYLFFPGLNLSWEVREGIVKHSPDPHHPKISEYSPELSPTLETLLVDQSDEIAYNNHDLDDGLTSKMIELEDLQEIELWQEAWESVSYRAEGALFPSGRNRSFLHEAIKTIIDAQVMDLVQTTLQNFEKEKIATEQEVRDAKKSPVSFSGKMKRKQAQLKNFLFSRLYQHYQVVRMTEKGKRILSDLFQTFTKTPKQLPPHIYKKIGGESLERVVCDYLVGMTDKFALDEHQRLFSPQERFLTP